MEFQEGDTVVIIGGDLNGVVGKIHKTDSLPGTESVFYLAPWLTNGGGIAYNIPAEHLKLAD